MLRLNQLTGFDVVGGSGIPAATGVEFLATMTTDSAPSPQVASASSFLAPYNPFKGFDKSPGLDMWSTNSTATGWLAIDTGLPRILWSYSVQCRGDTLNTAPQAWTLEGSDNGATWTVVDTQTGQTGWTASQVRTFTLLAGVEFRHYRINVSANNGNAFLQIGELRLFS